jgi:tyrosyl-tRNA synthetase
VDVDRQLELLTAGTVDVISPAELRTKLQRGRPLRVKLGIDPTASDIHLGFAVVLRRLRLFQDLGHVAVLILGDFTAMVGDPSGKSVTRPQLSKEEVDAHAQTYIEQAARILDQSPARLEIRRNSEWLGAMDIADVLRITSQVTVARMLERDDFAKRYQSGLPIAIHEFLYPLAQGYDSVALKADVELGGTDQKFNLLVGRELQRHYGQEPQCILTLPLLEGLDGVNKMSKSLDNTIGITEAPNEMFGKLMSISDELMWRYIELLSFKPLAEIAKLRKECAEGRNPREAKVMLAQEIVARFHGRAAADAALAEFESRFRDGALPESMPEVTLHTAGAGLAIPQLCKQAGLTASTSEAMRLVEQRGLKIDGDVVTDKASVIAAGRTVVVQAGKRKFARVTVS